LVGLRPPRILRAVTRRLVALVWLAFAVLWGAWIRVDTALSDPNFDARDARGMLRSDPALLYYLTEEIERGFEEGRLAPADFRADPRIQHPFVTDVPADFPVGEEYLVALARFLLGEPKPPLHVVALVVSSFVAGLFLVGVFGLVRALTSGDLWASLAVLLALVTPANYRTIGFLLVGEDLSLPLYLVHLAWLARAVVTGRGRDYLASGALAAGALATWHAASFVVTLELGAFVLGALATGRSPLAARRAWLVLVPPAAAALAVPVLRASGLLLSPAAALALALLVPALVERRRALTPLQARAVLVAVLLVALPVLGGLAPSSYAHVRAVVLAKLRFLGRFPDDPRSIPFDARLLWQGPFETLAPADVLAWSGWPLALLFGAGLVLLRRRTARGFELFLFGLALLALPVAWMFGRLAVLVGLLAPTCAALAFARWERRGLALVLFGGLTLVQAALFAGFVGAHRIAWYPPGPARAELTALVEFVRANVPPDEPIAGDFVNSTALLAHTRHPIVLQPKYETDRSRREIEAFLTTFFLGSTSELEALLRERFRCRHLLVDRHVLWDLSRVTAGLGADEHEPRPGTAAEAFLSSSDEVLARIPGFELLYRSPPGIPGADYRLFRMR
jgi:hypothetical protein